MENQASTLAFPSAVNKYLETEVQHKAMVGPYEEPPFEKLHVSPLMTRPKPDGSHRIIVDLSWPHGESVNSCIPDDLFDEIHLTLRYPNMDHIVERIQELGPHTFLYKVDLKHAFRNLRTDPRDLYCGKTSSTYTSASRSD